MYDKDTLNIVDLSSPPPKEEPARQYYFMTKCREQVKKFEEEYGHASTACVTTFGCPNVWVSRIPKSYSKIACKGGLWKET